MANNYVQDGRIIDLVAPAAVASGEGALVGALFGIAISDLANGEEGPFGVAGVYSPKKKAATAMTLGAKAYWDNAAKEVTPTVGSNTLIGFCTKAALAADTTVEVLLAP